MRGANMWADLPFAVADAIEVNARNAFFIARQRLVSVIEDTVRIAIAKDGLRRASQSSA